jgi:hypothetical protein
VPDLGELIDLVTMCGTERLSNEALPNASRTWLKAAYFSVAVAAFIFVTMTLLPGLHL